METVKVPIEQLVLDPQNARKGDVASILESLREFGQHRAIVVQRNTNRVIVGNHTLKAAKMLGWTEIDAYFVDDDDITAIRRGIADNATGDLATWDLDQLGLLVAEVGDDIPGLDASLLKSAELKTDELDEEEEPAYPIVAQLSESYHCAIIFATNDIDWAFLCTALQLNREKSYKNTHIGQSHVLNAEQFGALWRARGGEREPQNTDS